MDDGDDVGNDGIVEVEVGRQSTPIQVGADGSGVRIRQGNLDGPTAFSIPLPAGGPLDTEIPAC